MLLKTSCILSLSSLVKCCWKPRVLSYRNWFILCSTFSFIIMWRLHTDGNGGGNCRSVKCFCKNGVGLDDPESGFFFHTSKKILLFTPLMLSAAAAAVDPNWGLGSRLSNEPFLKCPVKNCYITTDRSLISRDGMESDFDAVLFNVDNQSFTPPQQRRSWQRYIMHTADPYYDHGKRAKGFYNWTMSYRRSSDIPVQFSWMEINGSSNSLNIPQWETFNSDNFQQSFSSLPPEILALAKRPKRLAWLVPPSSSASCNTSRSQRENYASLLSRHFPLDLLGDCGNNNNNSDNHEWKTLPYLPMSEVAKEYKFVLAMEESLCEDYVTGVFFEALKYNLVPIVLGKADYSLLSPPHSYVNIMDFRTAEDLANHIIALDFSPQKYLSYFWWKNKYGIKERYDWPCRLCSMLNSNLPNKEEVTAAADCEGAPFPWSNDRFVYRKELFSRFARRMHANYQKNKKYL